MQVRWAGVVFIGLSTTLLPVALRAQTAGTNARVEFRTADRCVACHNGLKTSKGEDVSIGTHWRASIMANASRDPYWIGSVRRESIDHPESQADIENECSICHMPMEHLAARDAGRKSQVFTHLPLSDARTPEADGVSCSVCHQMEKERLGTPESYNGNVVIAPPKDKNNRPEYGPFVVDRAHQLVMQSSTGGMVPQQAEHIRDSALCGSCHTLITTALGPGGKQIGALNEQMPYEEWLHSAYPQTATCQSCHMPEVEEPVAVSSVYGPKREGMHRHVFVGGNFLVQNLLNIHRSELGTAATTDELLAASELTRKFLATQAATVSIDNLAEQGGGVSFDVTVQNTTGHKLPTAYPSRRAWLHVTVRDAGGKAVFESGALNADGSIVGNDNDADGRKFEPHYGEITSPEQVEIYEPILGDDDGAVTTGLLRAVRYLKDNRIPPSGFDKKTVPESIGVFGEAKDDPKFGDGASVVRYSVNTGAAAGPFRIEVELLYQPIGFRWAHNLEPYTAMEPERFVGYYKEDSAHSAQVLARSSR